MFLKIYTKDAVRDIGSAASVSGVIRSKDRVRDNAEVFTQPREVCAMLDLIAEGPIPATTTHLEPSCGDGAFLSEIIARKAAWVRQNAHDDLQRAKMMIVALGSTYGIDISLRNVSDAQARILDIVRPDLEACGPEMINLAESVISSNIVVGNFMKARGVKIGSIEWKKMKPADRGLLGYEGDAEDILFVSIAPAADYLDEIGFNLKTFRLRSMQSECLGVLNHVDLTEQLINLAFCDGSEVIGIADPFLSQDFRI